MSIEFNMAAGYRQIGGSMARMVNLVAAGGAMAITGSILGSAGISVMPHLISGLPATP